VLPISGPVSPSSDQNIHLDERESEIDEAYSDNQSEGWDAEDDWQDEDEDTIPDEGWIDIDEDDDDPDLDDDGVEGDPSGPLPRSERSKRSLLEGSLQYERIVNLITELDSQMESSGNINIYRQGSLFHRAPNPTLYRHFHKTNSPNADYARDILVWVGRTTLLPGEFTRLRHITIFYHTIITA
ncbi:hypothetical protein HDU79_000779, partial [Rhizoclosmatium sp. JEL0117]